MSYVLLGCRCLIGIVFLVSVVGKARSRSMLDDFVDSTRTLLKAVAGKPIHRRYARWVAYAVVIAETAVPILLVLNRTAWLGFIVATGVVTAFTVAIAAALRDGERSPCRCFGASQNPLSRLHLVRNGLLIVVAVTGVIAGLGQHGALRPAGVVLAAGAASVLAFLLIRFDDLAELFSPPTTPVRQNRQGN